MATVTPLKVGSGNKNHGSFRIAKFSLFDDDDLQEYEELRNKDNDASSGVKIEMIREYQRKRTTKEGSGEDQVVHSWEEIILVVQYWEKAPSMASGGKHDHIQKDLAQGGQS